MSTSYSHFSPYSVGEKRISPSPMAPHFQNPSFSNYRHCGDCVEPAPRFSLQDFSPTLTGIGNNRATLPDPTPEVSPGSDETLELLKDAFCRIFSVMGESLDVQINDYAKLQQLSQTQASIVLQTTSDTLQKQEKVAELAAQIAAGEENSTKTNNDAGIITMVVGFALLIVSAALAPLDGAASLAALPEEIEMLDLGVEGEEVADGLGEGALLETEGVNGLGEEVEADGDLLINDEETTTTTNQSLEKTADSEVQGTASFGRDVAHWLGKNFSLRKIGFFILKTGMGAIFASPMLAKGMQSLNLSEQMSDLAAAQADIGKSLAGMQSNNMYYQFLQKTLRRAGDVAQQTVENASEVVETYGQITNAYRSITYGLANAV